MALGGGNRLSTNSRVTTWIEQTLSNSQLNEELDTIAADATDYLADALNTSQNFYFATGYCPARAETPEERAARKAAWRARDEVNARRREEARGATERAEGLLKERLGRYRYKVFQITRSLSRKSLLWPGIMYVVRRDAKVQVVERGRVKTELCVISGYGEPEADRIMSILDLLETDETRLWEMANVFPSSHPAESAVGP